MFRHLDVHLADTFDMPKCPLIIDLTLPLEMPQSEASLATLIRQSFSTSHSTQSTISLLMTVGGRSGLGSSKESPRPRLKSADHFANVEYFGLLSPCTSAIFDNPLIEALYGCSELNILTFDFCL